MSTAAHRRDVIEAPPAPHPSACEHVTDALLRRWYAENPTKLCARCWLAGRPVLLQRDGAFRTF